MARLLEAALGQAPMQWQFNPDGLIAIIDGPVQKSTTAETAAGKSA